jgi:hypothetical protein
LIDDMIRSSDHISTTDVNVIDEHNYQYAARLVYRTGTTDVVAYQPISYKQIQSGKVDTQISDVSVIPGDSADVRFDVRSNVNDTTLSIVKDLLDRSDVSQFFGSDIDKEREFLNELIAHNIQRVDLTTGDREDFGIITTTSFSDVDLRERNAVKPLELGHKYRYEVYALIRSPETMFETFRKSRIDPVTKKPYSFNPSKFLHPVTLKHGVIVSSQGLKTRFGLDQMVYGSIGLTATLDVSLDGETVSIVDVSASRFNRVTNLVTWRLQGNVNKVDHFIVMSEVNGVRKIVGKAHSEFPYGNCQMYHDLTVHDVGEVKYVIVPVMIDYRTGTSVSSNTIEVEDTW